MLGKKSSICKQLLANVFCTKWSFFPLQNYFRNLLKEWIKLLTKYVQQLICRHVTHANLTGTRYHIVFSARCRFKWIPVDVSILAWLQNLCQRGRILTATLISQSGAIVNTSNCFQHDSFSRLAMLPRPQPGLPVRVPWQLPLKPTRIICLSMSSI